MGKFVLKRLLALIPTILIIVFVVYFILDLTPSDPGHLILGQMASEEAVAAKNAELGYDKPFTVRYAKYIWDLCHGSLGNSWLSGKGVFETVMARFPVTVTLAAGATGLGILGTAHDMLPYGGWELVAVGIACLVFAYFYTAGPWPLAYHGLGDVAVILFFGVIPVGFTYYVQTGNWTPEVTLVSLACGLVIDTMLMVNNFRDREEDARCRKRTVVVVFGAGVGRWGYLLLGLVPMALCLGLLATGRLWAALLPLPYAAAHIATWRKMVRIDHGEELNVCLGETARNIMLFGTLMTLGILLG